MGFEKGAGFASDSFEFVLVCFPEVTALGWKQADQMGRKHSQGMLLAEDSLGQAKGFRN